MHSPVALSRCNGVNLSDMRGRPHKQRRRRARSVGAIVVSPLDACPRKILGHEFLLLLCVVQKVLRRGELGVRDYVQHLRMQRVMQDKQISDDTVYAGVQIIAQRQLGVICSWDNT